VAASSLLAALPLVAACGGGGSAGAGDRPTIVVTTPILGDVVSNLVGDEATVEVIMPAGADPHEFQASAREAAEMREADVVVANGGGFEHGLEDAVDGAEADGVPVFHAAENVTPPAPDTPAEDGVDPHFFTDPARMAEAAEALAEVLEAEVEPTELADALADEVGEVEVVPLHSETLGEPGSGADTYRGMVRTNAELIAAALAR
jgi:zinc/manganese transport system substrate-binding protein